MAPGEAVSREGRRDAGLERARGGGGRHGQPPPTSDGDEGDERPGGGWGCGGSSMGLSVAPGRDGPAVDRAVCAIADYRSGRRTTSRAAQPARLMRGVGAPAAGAAPAAIGRVAALSRHGLARDHDRSAVAIDAHVVHETWPGERARDPGAERVGRWGDVDSGRLEPDAVVAHDEADASVSKATVTSIVRGLPLKRMAFLQASSRLSTTSKTASFGHRQAAQEGPHAVSRAPERRGHRR